MRIGTGDNQRWTPHDNGAVAVFAAIAAVCTLFWWRGVLPFPFLGSDAANIASFAAAGLRPEAFVGDAVLSDSGNFRFYTTIYTPLLRALSRPLGDLGTAFLALLFPVILLQAIGFYVLGRVLFADRWPALLLAIVSLGKIDLTIDYWGVYHDAQPRMMFQAFLPFALAAALKYGDRPKAWPWLLAAHGMLIYVHPVSAPSVALATLLALFCLRPPGNSFGRQFGLLFASGLVFLGVCAPFLAAYMGGHEHGISPDYEKMIGIYRSILGDQYVDVTKYLDLALTNWKVQILLPAWGITGFVAVWFLARERRRETVFLLMWLVGILISSVAITWAEQSLGRRYGFLPLEVDLIRNVRYVSVVLLIFGIWGAYLAGKRIPFRLAPAFVAAVALVWVGLNRPGSIPFRKTLECFRAGHILCPPDHVADDFAALEVLRTEVPGGTVILPVVNDFHAYDFTLAIRYYAFKPVVYTAKDGGLFVYANHKNLSGWLDTRDELRRIYALESDRERVSKSLRLAERLGARLVVFDFPVTAGDVGLGGGISHRSGPFTMVTVP